MKIFDWVRYRLALRKLTKAQRMAAESGRDSERGCAKLNGCIRKISRLRQQVEIEYDNYQKKTQGRRKQLDSLLDEAETQERDSAELLRKQGVAIAAMQDESGVHQLENQLLVALNEYKVEGLKAGISEQVRRQVLHSPDEKI